MKNTRKITAILMVMAMLMAALSGCGGDSSGGSASSAENKSGDVYHVGIVQQLEHPALDQATEGFKAALIEKLGEDGVEFDLQNAQNEPANCATISQGFVSANVDLIMANATTALQSASAATADIPIVATSITDYATALNAEDWQGVSGTNVTGTSDLAPLQQQVEMITELVPDPLSYTVSAVVKPSSNIFECDMVMVITDFDRSYVDSGEVLGEDTANTGQGEAEVNQSIENPAGNPCFFFALPGTQKRTAHSANAGICRL